MNVLTLLPAYGRSYKSKKAILEDWHANKDFIATGYGVGERLINKEQVQPSHYDQLNFRYPTASMPTKVAVVSIKEATQQ